MPETTSYQAAPAFVEDRPDYGREVVSVSVFATRIVEGRDGSEQRFRLRCRPRMEMRAARMHTRGSLYNARRRALQAQQAVLCLPSWTDWITGYVWDDIDTFTFSGDATEPDFRRLRSGGYVYLTESGLTSTFRLIDSISGTTVSLDSAANAAFPDIAKVTYTTEARIYPCVLGIKENGIALQAGRSMEPDETMEVREL